LTEPTERAKLVQFYQLVQPAGPGWNEIRTETGSIASPDRPADSLLAWSLGCAFVYAALFGAGSFLYGNLAQGLFWSLVLLVSLFGLSRLLPRIWASSHG
jgi:solute:Na+ symporter, SSS family